MKRRQLSFWILCAIGIICLLAPIIVNDKPLLIKFQGRLYFPLITDYSEKDFGGELYGIVDYRDKFLHQTITMHGGWIIFPPIPFSYKTIDYDMSEPFPASPSLVHFLGTDDQGRDILVRIIYGMRSCLIFSLSLTAISLLLGLVLGSVQGYFGGWTDILLQRFTEIWAGLPLLFLLIILSSIIRPNFWWLLGIMSLFGWMGFVHYIRAEFLRIRKFDFVRAAKIMGASHSRIIFIHILPNALSSTLSLIPFIISGNIAVLASLDFLGFGLPSDSASLGEILSQGKNNLFAPWISLSVFFTMSILLSSLIFVGMKRR